MSETLEWLRAVWGRRKWLAVLAFLVPLTVGLTVVVALPKIYRATVTVLVIRQQIPETLVTSTVTSALETRLKTISQEILSRSRLEALRERFGLYQGLQTRIPPDQVIERLRSDIHLELLKGVESRAEMQTTVAFTLSYQGTAPRTVADVANALAGYYIEENVKAREVQASGTAEFLRVQLEQTKQRLDQQERKVSEFKRRHLGELPQQMEANLATLERLQMQLRLNADGQIRAQERRSFLSAQLSEAGALIAGPAGAAGTPDNPAARLAKLQQALAELKARYSDKYPDVVQTQAEIAALTAELAGAKAKSLSEPVAPSVSVPNPVISPMKGALTEAETELKVLKTEDGRLRASIAAYQGRIEKIPEREQEFKELARDYETTRDVYQSLLKRHGDAQIAESMEQRQKSEQFRIIEAAMVPTRPVTSPLRLLLMVVVISMQLAVGLVIVAEKLDASFHTIDQVRGRTSLPVLIGIPRIVTDAETRWRRTRFRLAAVATCIALVVLMAASHYVAHGNEQLVTMLLKTRQ